MSELERLNTEARRKIGLFVADSKPVRDIRIKQGSTYTGIIGLIPLEADMFWINRFGLDPVMDYVVASKTVPEGGERVEAATFRLKTHYGGNIDFSYIAQATHPAIVRVHDPFHEYEGDAFGLEKALVPKIQHYASLGEVRGLNSILDILPLYDLDQNGELTNPDFRQVMKDLRRYVKLFLQGSPRPRNEVVRKNSAQIPSSAIDFTIGSTPRIMLFPNPEDTKAELTATETNPPSESLKDRTLILLQARIKNVSPLAGELMFDLKVTPNSPIILTVYHKETIDGVDRSQIFLEQPASLAEINAFATLTKLSIAYAMDSSGGTVGSIDLLNGRTGFLYLRNP